LRAGAAYDPATDSWRPIADAPEGRAGAQAVWTGREMIVWGGLPPLQGPEDSGDGPGPRVGLAYHPATDGWRELPEAPVSSGDQAAVWTGEELLVVGVDRYDGSPVPGAAYDPATDRWRTLPPAPDTSIGPPSLVWTGQRAVAVAAQGTGGPGPFAMAYDPAADAWEQLPTPPLRGYDGYETVWTGEQLLVWGSEAGDGYTYRP